MQELDEKGERGSDYGQTAISVLRIEDLAIVTLLLVTLLASTWAEASVATNAVAGILDPATSSIAVSSHALHPT